ncbi:oligosaccharide flippase family protein [Solibacillus isronensis]|uniref:oligosaccharide flippase family protein n=1 Tax=Solibacillus isronensis TaxID=412383 RepID=UPI0009A5CC93|nr:oligosaccharide flippase family protein [Solibacillus isronensis]
MSQLKAGAILSYLSIFVTILIALLYTPIMIRLLGQTEYGLYALIGSVAAYFSILDLGLGNAIVRYTARNRAIGDKQFESKLNGMFLILYSLIGVLTILVGIILFNTIEGLFGKSLTTLELEKAKVMVIILIINFALSFPLAVFGSIMQAYERFITVKTVGIIRSIMIPFLTLPILFLGYGSVSMVVVTTIVNISCLLFNVYYCFKHLKINFYFGKIDLKLLKEILGYSFFVFLGVVVDQINWNTDQFILGIFTDTAAVAVYAIGMLFIKLYLQFSTSISGLLLPMVSMMVANNANNEKLTGLMIKYGRVQYIIMAYILIGFILFGQPFINIWAGSNYDSAYYIVLIILIPLTIPLIQNTGLSILRAKNLQGFRSIVLMLIAVLNILISIPLVKHFGGIGAAIGTGFSLTIGNSIIMNIYYHRRIGINIPIFWKNILYMTMPVVISLVVGYGINFIIPQNSLLFLIFKIVLFSISYILLLWFYGLNEFEKELFISFARAIKKTTVKFRFRNKT